MWRLRTYEYVYGTGARVHTLCLCNYNTEELSLLSVFIIHNRVPNSPKTKAWSYSELELTLQGKHDHAALPVLCCPLPGSAPLIPSCATVRVSPFFASLLLHETFFSLSRKATRVRARVWNKEQVRIHS